MAEPTVPEEVYREAAEAAARTNAEPPHVFDAWAAMGKAGGASPAFKAAVELAYRAGYERTRRDRQAALDDIAAHPAVMRQAVDLATRSAMSLGDTIEAILSLTNAAMRDGADG